MRSQAIIGSIGTIGMISANRRGDGRFRTVGEDVRKNFRYSHVCTHRIDAFRCKPLYPAAA